MSHTIKFSPSNNDAYKIKKVYKSEIVLEEDLLFYTLALDCAYLVPDSQPIDDQVYCDIVLRKESILGTG